MYCPQCGIKNKDIANYCCNCGANIIEHNSHSNDSSNIQLVESALLTNKNYNNETTANNLMPDKNEKIALLVLLLILIVVFITLIYFMIMPRIFPQIRQMANTKKSTIKENTHYGIANVEMYIANMSKNTPINIGNNLILRRVKYDLSNKQLILNISTDFSYKYQSPDEVKKFKMFVDSYIKSSCSKRPYQFLLLHNFYIRLKFYDKFNRYFKTQKINHTT